LQCVGAALAKRAERGVSELAAAALLALIVLTLGGIVLSRYYFSWSQEWHAYASHYQRALSMASEGLVSLVYGYYNSTSGTLVLVLAVGSGGGAIDAIYVDNQLYWRSGEGNLSVNGAPSTSAEFPPSGGLVEISVSKSLPAPPDGALHVKLVTEAGNQYSFSVVAR